MSRAGSLIGRPCSFPEETDERFLDYLTAFGHGPSIVLERAIYLYSFRFSELTQPI